ncbi:hypothetical protein OSB04_007989 [Centaurea solstitialis]|uniref:Beta-glucosidase n=1 Tax=Centaurea solstitialis TaxID=347529 RepID=A0AA38TKX5_9ASTR|nr:hypothetical protein OSB04_007989 [Centaurea solstitialis]
MSMNSVPIYLIFAIFTSSSMLEASSINGGGLGFKQENPIKRSDFPTGFLFGAATSAYQVEGAYLEDGKSLSNWDKDIEMMHSLGLESYRFSISWSRILPRGRFGEVNPLGIKFYNEIIDDLLRKGIKPFVTIHHEDFPQELEQRYGSWLDPQMQYVSASILARKIDGQILGLVSPKPSRVRPQSLIWLKFWGLTRPGKPQKARSGPEQKKEDFVLFAETCFKSFGDRVKYWVTINEPNLTAELSYERGVYPPAHCSQPFGNCLAGNSDVEPLRVMHNMLLAHGKAAKLYHESFQAISIACFFFLITFFLKKIRMSFDPPIFGDYPQEMREYHGSELPRFSPEEKRFMKNSIDFIGINHYSAIYTKDCTNSSCLNGGDRAIKGFVEITGERDGQLIGEPTSMPRFFVVPRGMEEIVNHVKTRYNNRPMFITENGYSSPNVQDVEVDEILNDNKRVEFHEAYLASLAKAIRNGADVRGYFIWSLMDNYEWTHGYNVRFGLYYVDHKTFDRIPKMSARWYQDFLKNDSLVDRPSIQTDI